MRQILKYLHNRTHVTAGTFTFLFLVSLNGCFVNFGELATAMVRGEIVSEAPKLVMVLSTGK